MTKKEISVLVICLLAPYLLGVVGNTSFLFSEWNAVSRWLLSIISFVLFTVFFFVFISTAMENDNKPKPKEKL